MTEYFAREQPWGLPIAMVIMIEYVENGGAPAMFHSRDIDAVGLLFSATFSANFASFLETLSVTVNSTKFKSYNTFFITIKTFYWGCINNYKQNINSIEGMY